MADFGIGEMLLADAAGEAAIADAVGLSTADLIGSGAIGAAEAAGAVGAAEGAGALTAADLVASGAVPDLSSTFASGAFDTAGFQGIDALGQEIVDPVTRAIQAANMANTGVNVPGAFQGITELDAAQTADLMRNIDPRMVDTLQPITKAVSSGAFDTAGFENLPIDYSGVQDMTPAAYSGPASTVAAAPSYLDKALSLADKYKTPLMLAAGSAGIKSLLGADKQRYGINQQALQPYSGPLSKFKYDPSTYRPALNPAPVYYTPRYAMGGTIDPGYDKVVGDQSTIVPQQPVLQDQSFAAGGTPKSSPMADLMSSRDSMDQYMIDYQSDPSSVYQKAKSGDYNAMLALNKIHSTPNQNYAAGGIAQLAVGGKLLKGQGDGMSDSIQANISGKREARLADGEFVVPADVVSHLGNGSTDAGAKQLYAMMDKVRSARTGRKSQGRQITPQKYMPA